MLMIDQVINAFETDGIIATEGVFYELQAAPFATFNLTNSRQISSDYETLDVVETWEVQVFYRDFADRQKAEDIFKRLRLLWSRTDTNTWLAEDNLFGSTYTVQSWR